MDSLASFLSSALGLTDREAVSELERITTVARFAKGEQLIRQGEPLTHIPLLISGVVRASLKDAEGNDLTDCIVTRPGVPAVPSPDLHGPTPCAIEALTDSEVALVEIAPAEELLSRNLPFALVYIRFLQEAWQGHWTVKTVIRQFDARGRYLWFLESYPGVIDRIPHKYVASFLNITPVTLSRVRRALKEEQGE